MVAVVFVVRVRALYSWVVNWDWDRFRESGDTLVVVVQEICGVWNLLRSATALVEEIEGGMTLALLMVLMPWIGERMEVFLSIIVLVVVVLEVGVEVFMENISLVTEDRVIRILLAPCWVRQGRDWVEDGFHMLYPGSILGMVLLVGYW